MGVHGVVIGALERIAALMSNGEPRSTNPDGYCHCREPLTDSDVGASSRFGIDDGDDWCWNCQRPVDPEGGR